MCALLVAPAAAATPSPVDPIGGPLLAASGVVVDAAVAPPVNDAASYVVADVDSGAVLAAKQAHLRLPPASTLKVLTALALLPELDKAQIVAGSQDAAAVEGSKVGIEVGLSYSIDLLFTALLLQSGNDAAQVLADAYGDVTATVAQMNAVALELQAYDTVAVNPSGLDQSLQLTSAYDLALITRAALEREDFRTYLLTPRAVMPGRDGATFEIQNENRLVASYDGAIGVKNGFTTLARHTFVGAATRDGRTYVAVVMRTETRPEPIVAGLLDWAFANADAAEPVGELVGAAPPMPVVTAVETPSMAQGTEDAAADEPAVAASGSGGNTDPTTAIALVALGLVLVGVVLRLVQRRRRAPLRPTALGPSGDVVRDG
jgi:D-alanyl-D-alanine carboxypeptidase (penicillin-binding protein 5/6)